MAESISELYSDYKKRLEEVDSLDQEILSSSDKADWLARLQKKSEIIREYYRVTEQELETFIRPILEGKENIDEEKAEQIYLGAYDYFMNVMSDDVLGSQMFIKLWDYFQKGGNEYYERSCKYAFSNSPFLNVEGELQKLGKEQADWISNYVDQIDHLRKMHSSDEEFVKDVQHVAATIEREYEMESQKFEPNVNYLIQYFNKLSKVRKYRKYFSDDVWAQLEKSSEKMGRDVMFKAALYWNQLEEDKKKGIGPALPLGFLEQKNLTEGERDLKTYVGYIVYAYHTEQIPAEEAYVLLRSYWNQVSRDVDYSTPEWKEKTENTIFDMIRYAARPMLEMIRSWKGDGIKKTQHFANLLYEIKSYIETIPRECACKDYLDQTLYHVLYDLIPFIEDEAVALEFIDCMVISRQVSTLIHAVMTAKLCDLVLEPVVQEHPELFREVLGVKEDWEVLTRKEELRHMLHYSARVHDIGKILIANIINTQIRRLTDMEYSYIRLHPKWSYEILNRNEKLASYAEIALGHHKSYDGKSGYPTAFDNTASKYRIMIDILTICDCMDAGTDRLGRNYMPGKSFDELLEEFVQGKGTLYRPELVDLLIKNRPLTQTLAHITGEEGRTELYYQVYRKYK